MSKTQRCYYEVIGCERDATPEEIKKAYRKAALAWHPDKNMHRAEEADLRFKEIQNAYDVLSSPHDRAWYDSHRDQILRGEDGSGAEAGRPDDEINLWPLFSPSAFKGFHSGPKGFYSVFGEVFAALFAQESRLGAEDEAPDLGDHSTPNAQVSAFYAYWCNFTTLKEFAWADKYNLSTAPSRKVRRLMEEENRKERRKFRREFLELVRQLATHCRKKDPRVAKAQAEAEAAAREKEAEVARRRKEEKEERLARALATEEPEWIRNQPQVLSFEEEEELQMQKMKERERQEKRERREKRRDMAGVKEAVVPEEGKQEEDEEDEEEEPKEEELFCAACRKTFKNANQWRNHEKSKKHLEKVAELKRQLQEEEAEMLREEEEEEEDPHTTTQEAAAPSTSSSGVQRKLSKKDKKKAKKRNQWVEEQKMAREVAPGGDSAASKGRTYKTQDELEGDEGSSSDLNIVDADLKEQAEEEDSEADDVEEDDEAILARMANRQKHGSRNKFTDVAIEKEDDELKTGDGGASDDSPSEDNVEEDEDDDDDDSMLARMVSRHQRAAKSKVPEETRDVENEAENRPEEVDADDDDDVHDSLLAGKVNRHRQATGNDKVADDGAVDQDEEEIEWVLVDRVGTPDACVRDRSSLDKAETCSTVPQDECGSIDNVENNADKNERVGKSDTDDRDPPPTIIEKKGGRGKERKAARRAAAAQGGQTGGTSLGGQDALKCKICGMCASSKNQLFKHLKATGHAIFK